MPNKIFIVDDHPIILRSLRDILELESGNEVIGEAKGIHDAKKQILALKPDIAIIDLTLEDGNGLELIEDLRALRPDIRLIVYSMRENIQTIADVYRAGAMAYVPKSGDPMELITAIAHVIKGRHYFVGDTAERLAEYHAKGNPNDPIKKLTSREFEIFKLAAQGQEVGDIAQKLDVGAASISNRLVTIRKKLGLTSQIQFTMLALKYGHIQPDSLTEKN